MTGKAGRRRPMTEAIASRIDSRSVCYRPFLPDGFFSPVGLARGDDGFVGIGAGKGWEEVRWLTVTTFVDDEQEIHGPH
jgi:hypothetical protein